MAADFIAIDRTKNQGAQLLNLIARLQVVTSDAGLLKDIMDHNVVPTGTLPADYDPLAALFGVDNVVVATNAQTVYNAMAQLIVQLDHPDVKTLMARVGH